MRLASRRFLIHFSRGQRVFLACGLAFFMIRPHSNDQRIDSSN
jgi:hypothetical protein